MKPTDLSQWRRTSPFAILFFFGRLLKLVAKNIFQSFAPLAAMVVFFKGDFLSNLMVAAIVFGLFLVVTAVLRYWYFRFSLTDDSVLIRSGIIKKTQVDIKFDRIQAINTEQNIVFRRLGLVTVAFDTAGSPGDEGNIPAVTREFADELRSRIGPQRATQSEAPEKVASASIPLLQLSARDMFKIGISDGRALLILAFVGPLAERLGEDENDIVGSFLERVFGPAGAWQTQYIVSAILGVVIVFLLLLMLFSVIAAFLRYHQFKLHLDGSTLRSDGGLLTRHEHSMELSKIQTLRVEQGLILRWLGRVRLTARQARSGRKQGNARVFTIPILTIEEADAFRQRFFDAEGKGLTLQPFGTHFSRVSKYLIRAPILVIGVLPSILLTAAVWSDAGPAASWLLLWIPLVALVAWQSWRRSAYHLTDDGLVRRTGFIGVRTVALLFRKVQRVTLTQSPLQRRKQLATLRFYMASGSVKIPFIPLHQARQIRDHVLFCVESSQKRWY